MAGLDHSGMLAVALAEARKGLAEGGIPIGAAIFDAEGRLVGSGHNRRVQNGDPSMHGETDAFAMRDASVAIAASPWLQRWRRAGTAADWCGSFASVRWWSERVELFRAAWTGSTRLEYKFLISIHLSASRC